MLSALVGANKRVVDVQMPHLASLLKPDLPSALGERGVVRVAVGGARQLVAVAQARAGHVPVVALDPLRAARSRVARGQVAVLVGEWHRGRLGARRYSERDGEREAEG